MAERSDEGVRAALCPGCGNVAERNPKKPDRCGWCGHNYATGQAGGFKPASSARVAVEDDRCPFCGRDPFHYVDIGGGMRPAAVVCCEEGIAHFAALSTPVPEEGLPREPASATEIHRLLFEGIRAMLIEGADPLASAEWASYDLWNAEGKARNRFYVETKRFAEELTAKIKSSPAINNRIAEYTRKRDLAFDDAERQYWQNMLDGELARNSPTAVPVTPMGTGEGLPRGTASAAEGHGTPCVVAYVDVRRVTNNDGSERVEARYTLGAMPIGLPSGRYGLHLGPASDDEIAAVDAFRRQIASSKSDGAEPGAGAASVLPSPLPSQGEPVAWAYEWSPVTIEKWKANVSFEKPNEPRRYRNIRPLYTAEALAAERARADRAEEDRDFALYCLYHADFAEIGMRYPDDGVSICTGLNLHALAAAKQLQKYGLVTINDSPSGPLVAWAPGRGRARTILKETPHGER